MIRRIFATTAAAITGMAVLASCTGERQTPGTATPAPSSSAELPNSGAPKVDNPLPAKVLEGSPCDSALTEEQLTDYLGQPGAAKPKDSELGPMCDWASTSGSGAGILVAYETKTRQGLSLTYRVEKPKASRWVDDLSPVQGYPAVGYVDVGASGQRSCVIVVGVADDLAYSISLVLGSDSGKDACQLGRGVADTVLTNLKARA